MMPDRTTKDLKAALAGALAPVMESEGGQAGPHPSVDDLIRYHGGDVDGVEEERVRHHLVACAECLETLLDLDGFVGAGAGGVDSGERRDGIVDLAAVRAARARREGAAGPGWRIAFAVAASLLVVASSLAVWVVQERDAAGDLRRQVAQLSAPQPDVPIVDLLPDSATRSETGTRTPVELPSGEDSVTFVLNLPQASELTDFEVDLVAPDGRVTWSGPVARSRYGTFTLGLRRRGLGPGENRVRLYGLEDGRRRRLETYTFRVEPGEQEP